LYLLSLLTHKGARNERLGLTSLIEALVSHAIIGYDLLKEYPIDFCNIFAGWGIKYSKGIDSIEA